MTQRFFLSRWFAPLLLGLAALAAAPARAGDVAVSIGFSQPGVYGRVDIGRYPQPVLVAPRPVYISQPVYAEPVYLWAPAEHRRDWRRHCNRYGACGAPVYFVEDNWYRHHVVGRHVHHHPQPVYRHHDDRRHHGHHGHHDRGHRHHHDRDRHHDHHGRH